MQTAAASKLRLAFFEYLFDMQDGYVCLALADPGDDVTRKKSFRQSFFRWPNQKAELAGFIDEVQDRKHIWFGVNLFSKAARRTEFALPGRLVYADLDQCNPEIVVPPPSIALETSPGRYHALWRIDHEMDPEQASEYARKIAYKYAANGADKSGWDITQLLRVPYTYNFKYEGYPEISVTRTIEDRTQIEDFEVIEIPEEFKSENGTLQTTDIPDLESLPNSDAVLKKYHRKLDDTIIFYIQNEPEEGADWSVRMWRVINDLLEIGATKEETFSIALTAKCNKYVRDNRPMSLLWREIIKAETKQTKINYLPAYAELTIPDIVQEPASESIIDRYVEYATGATDATPIFHELSAFIILSSLLAAPITLELSYGPLVPNLWGMILGESTLTRKTTAMKLATRIIYGIDSSLIAATDGSIEGLLQALSLRPAMSSIFFRDEISGFFEAITKREYLAGMSETLTHLYDVPEIFKRVLRKDTIFVEKPILIFYGGGIKDSVYGVLDDSFVANGFLPRFLVVNGDTNMERLQRTSVAATEDVNLRVKLIKELENAHTVYNATRTIKIAGQNIQKAPTFTPVLTPDAWELFGHLEESYIRKAYEHSLSNLALPTFERLSKSILKMSLLLGAVRQSPQEDHYEVSLDDMTNAIYYAQRWAPSTIELIYKVGKSMDARDRDRVLEYIQSHPGIMRRDLMRRYNYSKRQMDIVIETLIDRSDIRVTKKKNGSFYWPTS